MKKKKHKPLSKAELLARMPRAFRPRLNKSQQIDLGIAHMLTLDAIARGEAGENELWQLVGSILTWSRAAELIGHRVEEMAQQLELAHRMLERYKRTRRVLFSGEDYQLAKQGVEVMDELALTVDKPTALAAADWSEAKINQISASAQFHADAHAENSRDAFPTRPGLQRTPGPVA